MPLRCSVAVYYDLLARQSTEKEAESKMPNKLHEKRQRRQDLPQAEAAAAAGGGGKAEATPHLIRIATKQSD